ncbi:hypothetical protein I552_9181 [Mycobacterium xenopi 3993]|nr:hypothetical protein I552_9181 [Mycobacterium xenopi 3993]
MNAPRRCCRPGCPHHAVATLTFVYSDSTAVIGPLATAREPHSWDLCVGHAGRITAPRGWELVRHPGPLPNPDEDDLVALADAVREGRGGLANRPRSTASVILAARLLGTGQRREYRRAGFHRPPIQRKRTPSGAPAGTAGPPTERGE